MVSPLMASRRDEKVCTLPLSRTLSLPETRYSRPVEYSPLCSESKQIQYINYKLLTSRTAPTNRTVSFVVKMTTNDTVRFVGIAGEKKRPPIARGPFRKVD